MLGNDFVSDTANNDGIQVLLPLCPAHLLCRLLSKANPWFTDNLQGLLFQKIEQRPCILRIFF